MSRFSRRFKGAFKTVYGNIPQKYGKVISHFGQQAKREAPGIIKYGGLAALAAGGAVLAPASVGSALGKAGGSYGIGLLAQRFGPKPKGGSFQTDTGETGYAPGGFASGGGAAAPEIQIVERGGAPGISPVYVIGAAALVAAVLFLGRK